MSPFGRFVMREGRQRPEVGLPKILARFKSCMAAANISVVEAVQSSTNIAIWIRVRQVQVYSLF